MSVPNTRFISDLSVDQLKHILASLNQEDVKVHLFKFLHDVQKIYRPQRKTNDQVDLQEQIINSEFAEAEIGHESIGNGTLSSDFFDQIEILRKSCNDFEGLQKKLLQILNSDDQKERHDI